MLIPNGECNYLLSGKLPTVRQSYLLSGKLPTVRQATYSQACTQPSHRHAPKSIHRLAPNNRIHAPNRSIDMHPKGSYMHPKVAAYMDRLCVFLYKPFSKHNQLIMLI